MLGKEMRWTETHPSGSHPLVAAQQRHERASQSERRGSWSRGCLRSFCSINIVMSPRDREQILMQHTSYGYGVGGRISGNGRVSRRATNSNHGGLAYIAVLLK